MARLTFADRLNIAQYIQKNLPVYLETRPTYEDIADDVQETLRINCTKHHVQYICSEAGYKWPGKGRKASDGGEMVRLLNVLQKANVINNEERRYIEEG